MCIRDSNEKVLYTSTHDTSTLVGFCQKSFCSNGDEQGARYLAGEIMRHALDSPATLVMMQLQDLLCLGDDARMNVPGVAEGNWSWQADEDLICDYERKIAGVLSETGRTRA